MAICGAASRQTPSLVLRAKIRPPLTTGIVIYKPVQIGWLTALVGGYEWARWAHFWLAAGFAVFIAIHIMQVARAGWNTVVAMLAGDPE